MSVFVDTGLFVAYYNSRDERHAEAQTLLQRAFDGEWGTVYTSDYVFSESVTATLVRMRSERRAVELGERLLSPDLTTLPVLEESFHRAWALFKQKRGLSFTDCTTAALLAEHHIPLLLTFDGGFRQFREFKRLPE